MKGKRVFGSAKWIFLMIKGKKSRKCITENILTIKVKRIMQIM